MRTLLIVTTTALLAGVAQAQQPSTDEATRVYGEFAEEMQTCSVYQAVASQCLAQSDRPDLAAGARQNAEMYTAMAIHAGPDAGFNKQAMMAFNQHMTAAMRKAMSDDCTNIRC